MNDDSYEEQIIKFEVARNEAMDKYFNARQGLSRTKAQEDIFEGGFRMAWDMKLDEVCTNTRTGNRG